jgi:hypothetical protein
MVARSGIPGLAPAQSPFCNHLSTQDFRLNGSGFAGKYHDGEDRRKQPCAGAPGNRPVALGTSMGNIGAIAPARLISSSPPVIQSSEVFKTFGVGVFMIRLIAGETPMDRVDGVDNVD